MLQVAAVCLLIIGSPSSLANVLDSSIRLLCQAKAVNDCFQDRVSAQPLYLIYHLLLQGIQHLACVLERLGPIRHDLHGVGFQSIIRRPLLQDVWDSETESLACLEFH